MRPSFASFSLFRDFRTHRRGVRANILAIVHALKVNFRGGLVGIGERGVERRACGGNPQYAAAIGHQRRGPPCEIAARKSGIGTL